MGNDNILVIGIAGGSASGKTTLMKNLIADCEDEVTVLSHDNYYKRHDELTMEERSRLNYDEPDAFDTSLMVYHLDQLRHGHAVECPVYDFSVHNRSEETIHLEPRKVIIVEGILIFENQELRDLMTSVSSWIPMQTSVCAAGSSGMWRSGAAPWRACSPSTSRPSSPCTSAMWSPARSMPTWWSPRAARTWWPWI